MKKRKKCSFHKIISDIDKRLADNIPDYENKKKRFKSALCAEQKKEEKHKTNKNMKKHCTNSDDDNTEIKKNKSILYVVFGVIAYFLLILLISDPILAVSFLFLFFMIFIFLYRIINNGKINIFSFVINNKFINYFLVALLILSLVFGIKAVFFNQKPIDQSEINYYDNTIEKYDVNVDIKFNNNIIFNKYDVEIKLYDETDKLSHGVDKSLVYKLPNGKHKIEFTGDGMSEILELDVKGDTYVKYEITCHEDEIAVKEIKLEYRNKTKPIEEKETFEEKLAKFTKGYEKVASSDVSENTRVYFKGVLSEIDILGETEGNQWIVGYVEDAENKIKWGCILNSTAHVSKDYYDSYVKKEIYLRGLYIGKTIGKDTTMVNMDKIMMVESGEERTGIQTIIDSTGDDEIIMYTIPDEYIGKDYNSVEAKFKEFGFTNIKTDAIETTDSNNKVGIVAELTIASKTFKRGDKFKKTDEIKITYWVKKVEVKESVSYSTNDSNAVKLGNQGVYAYKRTGNREYDIFYIIDFDEGYVYYFIDGSIGDLSCSKWKIKSGTLNDVLIYIINDGGEVYFEGLHFKWKNQPDHLILEDNDHFEYDFYTTNLSSTLAIKNSRTCK